MLKLFEGCQHHWVLMIYLRSLKIEPVCLCSHTELKLLIYSSELGSGRQRKESNLKIFPSVLRCTAWKVLVLSILCLNPSYKSEQHTNINRALSVQTQTGLVLSLIDLFRKKNPNSKNSNLYRERMYFHHKTNKIFSFGFTPSSGNQAEILPPPSPK